MAAQNQRLDTEESFAEARPIELVTENGFSILRSWEIQKGTPPTDGKLTFVVRNSNKPKTETTVVVEFTADSLSQIEKHTQGRIVAGNTFWIYCAERHLADYVFEKDDYPIDGTFTIDQLTSEDFDQAMRWKL
jgi:hypothetical protein